MIASKEIEEIIKIGMKIGWLRKGRGSGIRVFGGNVGGFRVSTPWGSDCFSIDVGGRHLVFSSDQHVEGTHFETRYMSFEEIGERALRCAVSDVTVTGSEPLMAFVNVSASSPKIAERVGEGIIKAAGELGVKLCGGDIGRAERVHVSSFVVGVRKKKPLSRFGVKAGDHIFVTGTLGDSALAFQVIKKKGRRFAEKNIPNALEKFLRPPVRRIPKGLEKFVRFTSDLSDGIITVCQWICLLNSVSLEFFSERLPFSEEFLRFGHEFFEDPQSVALSWGEDYELLFGIDEKDLKDETDYRRMRAKGEVIGIVLSGEDCRRAVRMGYPRLRLKGDLFIFFSPLFRPRVDIGFEHFG